MSANVQDHVSFWKTFGDFLDAGMPLAMALEATGSELEGTPFDQVARAITRDMRAGRNLSRAMERQAPVFSRSVRMMVRAGEAGGVLDAVTGRIAEGLADGSFPVPGEPPPEGRNMPGFWRAFGRLLSSGVPILEVLDILAEEACDQDMRGALGSIDQAIRDGGTMSEAIREYPDLFDESVVAAVDWGEYRCELDSAASQIAHALAAGDTSGLPSRGPEDDESVTEPEHTAPVIKTVNLMLLEAFDAGATDIHVEPTGDGVGRARCRVDGALGHPKPFPEGMYGAIVGRLKVLADLDIAERRRPQDGRIELNVRGEPLHLRVSVVPTVAGESAALRVLHPFEEIRGLDSFLAGEDLAKVRALARRPHGIVVCSGPAGSGKSTLLYAMVEEIDRARCNVIAVENPVEYSLEDVDQVQVDPRLGLTFPVLLRAVMRHDPDVILVGDIRDHETAELVQRIAVTGHLVLTTMHTPTATATVKRLLDLGLEPFQVNAALAGVVSQRLVRKLCPDCRAEAEVSEATMPAEAVEFVRSRPATGVYAAKGCEECTGGYRGRMAIHEILVPDEEFRKAVARPADEEALRAAAVESGMKTLFQRGMERALEGVTSVEEVCRVAWDSR